MGADFDPFAQQARARADYMGRQEAEYEAKYEKIISDFVTMTHEYDKHMRATDFLGGVPLVWRGRRYMGTPLYAVHRGDGDASRWGKALYMLFNERGHTIVEDTKLDERWSDSNYSNDHITDGVGDAEEFSLPSFDFNHIPFALAHNTDAMYNRMENTFSHWNRGNRDSFPEAYQAFLRLPKR